MDVCCGLSGVPGPNYSPEEKLPNQATPLPSPPCTELTRQPNSIVASPDTVMKSSSDPGVRSQMYAYYLREHVEVGFVAHLLGNQSRRWKSRFRTCAS